MSKFDNECDQFFMEKKTFFIKLFIPFVQNLEFGVYIDQINKDSILHVNLDLAKHIFSLCHDFSWDIFDNDLEIALNELSMEIDNIVGRFRLFDKNVDYDLIDVDIKSGVGGDESSIFVEDILKYYGCVCEKFNIRFQVKSQQKNEAGGLKDVQIRLVGKNVYNIFCCESGVHRVQRVPVTESYGRVHTSTLSVFIVPVIDLPKVKLEKADIQIDTFRSSGAGGQHVNKTDSAVRIRHIPSGIVVIERSERSQHMNKSKALLTLETKLADHHKEKYLDELYESRNLQVSSAKRSFKIRTYNYKSNRVSDHRLGVELPLDKLFEGDFFMKLSKMFSYKTFFDFFVDVLMRNGKV